MFILLRRIERWLHQHVFKVGWLATHNYQTTTILYYTIFLPGVILHEVVYYLAAGIVNVRAERHIKWPDEQEIGELQLNFIKLAPRTSALRKAIITSAPLLVGLVCIWLIANNIFDITTVVETMSTGELEDVGTGINLLVNAPLFWLWVYIIFTIANTMFPTVPKDLRGWRSVMIGLGVVALALTVVGVSGEIFEALQTPLSSIILVLIETFVLIICIDLLMVAVLGTIEYTIERITGHSATFRGNRMITMTREEALAERERERERERKRVEREQRRKQSSDTGPTSIYALALAVPGAPGEEAITELEPLPEEQSPDTGEPEEVSQKPATMPLFGGLADETRTAQAPTEEEKKQREKIASHIKPPSQPSADNKDEEQDTAPPVKETDTSIQKPTRKPITLVSDQDAKSDAKDSSEDRATARQPVKLFADESQDDEAESADTGQPASTPSRFGTGTRSSQPTTEKSESTTQRPPARFSKAVPDKDVGDQRPAARFGTGSRFGKTSSNDDDESSKQQTAAIFGTPASSTGDEEQKPVARFGTASRFGKSSSDDDDDDRRDSVVPFGAASSEDIIDSSTDVVPPPLDDETIRVVGRPASPGRIDEVDEADDDDSLLRRTRGDDDAVADLFGSLTSLDATGDTSSVKSPADDEKTTSQRFGSRFGAFSSDDSDAKQSPFSTTGTASRFGRSGSRLAPASSEPDDMDDESITDSGDSPSTRRFGRSISGSRFGRDQRLSPFDAPSDDAGEDTKDEDIVYEDIDDEYIYEDVDDYADYDEDDYEYYDDDD